MKQMDSTVEIKKCCCICPAEKRECNFEEANRFRMIFVIMMVVHIGLEIVDILCGNFLSVIGGGLLCFAACNCYMRLTQTSIYGYVAWLVIYVVIGGIGIVAIFSNS